MTPSASLRFSTLSVRLAGHALAFFQDIAKACRPSQSVHSNGACLSQENPRVVISFVSFAYLRVHDRHLHPCLQQSTETVTPWATRIRKRSNQEVAR